MKNALTNTMSTLPTQLARSLTWDSQNSCTGLHAHVELSRERWVKMIGDQWSRVA